MLGRMYFNQASVPEHSIDWSCPYVVVGVKSDNNEVAGRHPYVQLSFKILNKGTSRVTIVILRAQVSFLLGEDSTGAIVGVRIGSVSAEHT
jgi:hypothetical protein